MAVVLWKMQKRIVMNSTRASNRPC